LKELTLSFIFATDNMPHIWSTSAKLYAY